LEDFKKGGEMLKKRILFILLALVLAVSISLIGCGGGQQEEEEEEEEEEEPPPAATIVLVASASTDGPLADVHNNAKGPIMDAYLADNPTLTVGSTTFTVEKKYYPDNSDMVKMLENTDDMIDEIKAGTAHFLVGPTCTAFMEAQATKCVTAKVVQMGMEGGATSLFPELDSYGYSFFNLSFSNWFEIPVLAKILAEGHEAAYPGDTPVACIGYQNDDHGFEYLGEAEKYFAKEGITICDTHAMTPGDTAACDDLVDKAVTGDADILCLFGYPEFVFAVHASVSAKNYDPDAIILGPGACFGVYASPAGAGAASEGVMTFVTGNNATSPAMAELFNTKLACPDVGLGPIFCQDFWGHPCYWTALDFIYAAAAAVGNDNDGAGFSINQDAYRSYLANTKLDSVFGESYYVTPDHTLGATEYSWADADLQWPVPAGSAGLLSYKLHHGEIGQWQNGYMEVIGYAGIGGAGDEYGLVNYVVTAPYWYPM
jgi:hypothetical protein